MKLKHPTVLIVLDGWGFAPDSPSNAITQAQPKTFNYLWHHYPHALLQASGTAVGLPEHIPGNSEVGHMTMGAGRIMQQPITRINTAIKDGSFFNNEHLADILQTCNQKNGRLHLLGLLSDGLVHSNIEHLFALIQAAAHAGIHHIYIHAFLDGRDVAPRSAETYVRALDAIVKKNSSVVLGSLSGRFYAMDRNENWERTCAAYDALVTETSSETSWHSYLHKNYAHNISDEFVPPALLDTPARIQDNDTLIFFNTRPDRMRQLVSLFLQTPLPSQKNNAHPPHPKAPKNLTVATMVPYHASFTNPILLEKELIHTTLLDILEQHNKTVFTIAETEKYAHVTYFFSGGTETRRANETRVLIPSPDVATYDLQPNMAAEKITNTVVQSLTHNPCDFYLINYANADMVGHTGNFEKTKEAITCLDKQLTILYKTVVQEYQGTLYITSDHGKAEQMSDTTTHTPRTAHTCNPVPFIMIRKQQQLPKELHLKELADIAPFIIKNMV